MKTHTIYKLFTVSLFALILYACVDVDKLSDLNTIESFTIVSGSPSAIEFGEITIKEDSVIVSILYGSDKFPLTLRADLDFTVKVDQIVGIDFEEGVTIEDINDTKEFYIMAESGLSRKYTLAFKREKYTVLSSVPFTYNNLSPKNSIIYNKATFIEEELVLSVVELTYPFSITPKFSEDDYTYEGFINGNTQFKFEDESTTHNIIVVDSETGSKRDISLRSSSLRIVSGGDGNYESTDLFNSDLSLEIAQTTNQAELIGFRIENAKDSLSVYIKPSGEGDFPLDILVEFGEVEQRCGLIGVRDGERVTLEGFDDKFRYYAVDPVAAIARYWQIVPIEYREPQSAEVLSFSYDYNKSHNIIITGLKIRKPIILDIESVDIFPQSREIWLMATEINNALASANWKVILQDIQITVSEGARYELPSSVEWIGNDSWKESVSFKVIASDESVTEWTINIRDFRDQTPSDEAEILDASIRYMLPMMAKADPVSPITLNESEKKISIRLDEDEDCYPLSVMLDYELSKYAMVVSQSENSVPIVFSGPDSVGEVVVKAEDGTESKWTVVLIQPEKAEAANVVTFSIDSYSSPVFETGSIAIDPEEGEILITLDQSGSCPATINYSMGLSRKATASVSLKGSFNFDNLNSVPKFTVTSSGGNTKEWSVKIAPHTPQLKNWDLEQWMSDDKTLLPAGKKKAPYWSSANNSFVTGTTKSAGKNGGYCAKLYTQTAVGNLASGSLLLGWFDASNPVTGLSDPVKLVFQGIEFSASKKLVGVEMDINYSSGGDGNDTGSILVEFVKQDPYDLDSYVYHGRRPDGTFHPDNTAISKAMGQHIIANKPSIGGTLVVPSNQWQTVRVDINYGSNDPLDYSHFVIICASSSKGDAFIGNSGTTMLIDNVKLIYEE